MKRLPTEEEHEKITQAIFAGDRAEATSTYISIKGCGLTEAQEFIKKLTAELKETKPEKFAGSNKRNVFFGTGSFFLQKGESATLAEVTKKAPGRWIRPSAF